MCYECERLAERVLELEAKLEDSRWSLRSARQKSNAVAWLSFIFGILFAMLAVTFGAFLAR